MLAGKDTLALLPTGGGKSICFQVPALAQEGMCLVVSPLIALMKDQVEALRKKGITAFAIYSGMTRKEVINILELATESNCRFLYVSPERLETALFKEYLPGMAINLIAVDEAHCVSQWGYDFRPPYLRIAALREELRGVPVIALTASATEEVQEDICEKLSLLPGDKNKWEKFRLSFERANLSYAALFIQAKVPKIISILEKVPGSAIIYCRTRKVTKEIADILQLHGLSADFYHAGLVQQERSKRQEDWINNRVRVIVCTNAFGMGIDKPDVRVVIHADVPDCLENYYQEAGRAGRDGKKAYAVLLYDNAALNGLKELKQLRFPSMEDVRSVYQSAANYLQVTEGSGMGQYYDFDLNDFLKKFKLNSHTVIYALKMLEQEEWVAFNEQVFLPSTVHFTITKECLYAFEKENPLLDPMIKTLLRTYEGIFDYPSFISELTLSWLLKAGQDIVTKQLTELHNKDVIAYAARKENPQLLWLQPRVRKESLYINLTALQERKHNFERRVDQMIAYTESQEQCRSKMIGRYFGDREIKNCGICDNCLRRKNSELSNEELTAIQQALLIILTKEPASVQHLLSKLSFKEEKILKVISLMEEEGLVYINKNGKLQLSS